MNRRSHTRFRLLPKLSTLDDLERPIRNYALYLRKDAFFGANDRCDGQRVLIEGESGRQHNKLILVESAIEYRQSLRIS